MQSKIIQHKDDIIKKYKSGVGCVVLAREYKVCELTILNNLRKWNIKINNYKIEKKKINKAIKLYKSGLSVQKVGKQLKISTHSILRALKKIGFERRTLIKYKFNPKSFNKLSRAAKYWIGMMLSDGCVCDHKQGQKQIILSLQKRDKKHLEKFRKFLESNHRIAYNKRDKAYRIEITSNEMAKVLSGYGVVPRKSYIANVKNKKLIYSADFWRGMLDGDGCLFVTKDGKSFRIFITGSKFICQKFLKFVKKHYKTKAKITRHGDVYRATVATRVAYKILKKLYANDAEYFLDRKFKKAQYILKKFNRFSC